MASPSSSLTVAAQSSSYTELFRAFNVAPWQIPPVDFVHFDVGPGSQVSGASTGAVALPAIGSTATILQFRVPRGRNGRITHFGIDFVTNGGAAFTVGVLPVQLTFSFFRDFSQGTKGQLFPGYEMFSFLPGSTIQPIAFVDGLMMVENQLVTLQVTNASVAVTTQFLCARVVGYYYPKLREPKEYGAR